MQIVGYKAFNNDKTNRYKKTFELNKLNQVTGDIKYGSCGNGYHLCTNICDVFRYFKKSLNINVALVVGSGKYDVFNDEYYGYYNMYATEYIKIIRFLSREEIINKVINSTENDIIKFIVTSKMSENEIKLFINLFKCNIQILKYILYYQLTQKDVFNIDNKKVLERVRKYGQNYN